MTTTYQTYARDEDTFLWQGSSLDDYAVGTRIVSNDNKMHGTIIHVRETKTARQFTVEWDFHPGGATRDYDLNRPYQFVGGLPMITNKPEGGVAPALTFVSQFIGGREQLEAALQGSRTSGVATFDIDSLMLALNDSGWTFTPKEG